MSLGHAGETEEADNHSAADNHSVKSSRYFAQILQFFCCTFLIHND